MRALVLLNRYFKNMFWSYPTLFVWCFLSASLVPISSEPYFVGMIAHKAVFACVMVATLGNVVGGMTSYFIGKKGGAVLASKMTTESSRQYVAARKMIQKHGSLAMLLSWVPLLGDIIVAFGGAMGLPFVSAMGWMAIGKFLRYFFLAELTLGFLAK
jgi:membrane protein YqaA with SNARE-associated domain